jgi:hypothetical protein
MRESFKNGDYQQCLVLLQRTADSIPALSETPVLSLFRALLLQRLGRQTEARKEIDQPWHQATDSRLVEARVSLLDALGLRNDAEALLTRMIATAQPSNGEQGDPDTILLKLRARIQSSPGD